MPHERRLVRRRPVRRPLLQMRVDVAQKEEARPALVMMTLAFAGAALVMVVRRRLGRAVQKVARPANGAHQLQLVVDGVKRGEAVDFVGVIWRRRRRRLRRGVLVMRAVVRHSLLAKLRVGRLVVATAPVVIALALVVAQVALDGRRRRGTFTRAAVVVDQILFPHSPRPSHVSRTRPVTAVTTTV